MIETNVTASANRNAAPDRFGSGTNILQVSIDPGITGQVNLFGRVSEDVAWLPLNEAPITETGLFPVLPVPFLRAEVTVQSGGGGSARIRVRSAQ